MNLCPTSRTTRAAAPALNCSVCSIRPSSGHQRLIGVELRGGTAASIAGKLIGILGAARGLGTVLLLAAFGASAQTQASVTLAWDASTSSGTTGYRLYWGRASRTYTNVINVGNATTGTVPGLAAGATYFFAATAYATNGLESDYSTEVSYTVPQPTNTPPNIILTAPLNGAIYAAPATISLAANVTPNGHTISQVQFYNGTTLLGAASATPYAFTWTNVSAGTYSLSATVVYDSGSKAGSATASVTVAATKPSSTLTFAADSGTFTAPFVDSNGTLSQSVLTSVTTGGQAIYTFNIAHAGNYLVSAQVIAPSQAQNSFYVNIDSTPTDPLMIWDVPVCSTLTSQTVSWRGNGNGDPATSQYIPKVFTLTAGTHKLIIIGREANTALGTITIAALPPRLRIRTSTGGTVSSPAIVPPPQISVILTATGQPGQTYNLLRSSDLKNWTIIGTMTLDDTGSADFTDSVTASQAKSFYRLQAATVTAPQLQIHFTAGSPVVLSGIGQPQQTYSVLLSQDFKSWTAIGTVTTDANGSFSFTDPASTSRSIGIYRLRGQ